MSESKRAIKMVTGTFLFCGLIVLLVPAIAGDRPLLTGRWERLPDESDSLDERIAEGLAYIDVEALQAARAAGHAAPRGAYRRKPTRKEVDSLLRFLDTVVPMQPLASIEHREPWVKLVYADGREREIYTDGRDLAAKVQTTAAQQDQKLQFASWEEDVLVIETNTSSGVSVLERYTRVNDPEKHEPVRLRVDVAIDSARFRDVLRLRNVYRPASGG